MPTTVLPPFGVMNKGTVATPATGTITAKEWGGDGRYFTELTISSLTMITTTNVSKADGKLIYTLPAGSCIVKSAAIAMAATSGATNAADTPVIGLGTTVASGAVNVLSGTAAFQNIMAGQAVADCAGAVKLASVDTILAVATSGDHTIYLNIADGWAGVDTVAVSGKVIIEWVFLS